MVKLVVLSEQPELELVAESRVLVGSGSKKKPPGTLEKLAWYQNYHGCRALQSRVAPFVRRADVLAHCAKRISA